MGHEDDKGRLPKAPKDGVRLEDFGERNKIIMMNLVILLYNYQARY